MIFKGEGVNGLYKIPTKFDPEMYVKLFKDKIIQTLRKKYPDPEIINFAQCTKVKKLLL